MNGSDVAIATTFNSTGSGGSGPRGRGRRLDGPRPTGRRLVGFGFTGGRFWERNRNVQHPGRVSVPISTQLEVTLLVITFFGIALGAAGAVCSPRREERAGHARR